MGGTPTATPPSTPPMQPIGGAPATIPTSTIPTQPVTATPIMNPTAGATIIPQPTQANLSGTPVPTGMSPTPSITPTEILQRFLSQIPNPKGRQLVERIFLRIFAANDMRTVQMQYSLDNYALMLQRAEQKAVTIKQAYGVDTTTVERVVTTTREKSRQQQHKCKCGGRKAA